LSFNTQRIKKATAAMMMVDSKELLNPISATLPVLGPCGDDFDVTYSPRIT